MLSHKKRNILNLRPDCKHFAPPLLARVLLQDVKSEIRTLIERQLAMVIVIPAGAQIPPKKPLNPSQLCRNLENLSYSTDTLR